MGKTIAVAGKGGTGKTTISSILVQLLSKHGTVLAIDADPSSNLHLCLGLPLEDTVGDVREDAAKTVRSKEFQAGMSKTNYLELGIRQALVESSQVDLIAMGRPEGPGCYCAANNVLRGVIDQLAVNYDYVVIDNEAGMEHISRQTTRDIDVLLIVSDPSIRGMVTATLVKDLIRELRAQVGRVGLIINRVEGALTQAIRQKVEEMGIELLATLPVDKHVNELDAEGEPLTKLSQESSLRSRIANVLERLDLIK